MEKYNLYLKRQRPIPFQDVCVVYQPSLDDIFDYGIDEFEQLLIPYCITVDNSTINLTDEQKKELKNFDLLCSSKEILDYLFQSLQFFCKSKIEVIDNSILFDGFEGMLNRNNFDEFAELILDICSRARPKVEKPPEFKNDRQRDIWEKLQEGRRRNAKNTELSLADILNVCEFGGDYYIPINEIGQWSLWRIMNCYKSKLGNSTYKDSFSIYLVSGEKDLVENKHWTDLLKLNYQYKE